MFKKLMEWSTCICLILVTAYSYNATPRQCGNGRGETYTGTHVRPGIIAVSHDLKYLLNKRVHLQGMGFYKVEDLMHRKHFKSIDIYTPSLRGAKRFGKQKIEMTIVGKE
jgi:3D (Asp-Asp-Asp) domain-containing protein